MWKIFKSDKRYQNLDAAAFEQMMQDNPELVLLDVRTAAEFNRGSIPGAKNLNVMHPDFKRKLQDLDPSTAYGVLCQSGGRSAQACKIMANQGFAELFNLSGGMSRWGGPVSK